MKKKLLMTAMVAALGGVGTAQAVHVNPDGLGQVLIYPYYTVQNGFDSYINLVNTTSEVKAVKVRFLEGKNSQEVLDFNLYLSPNDEWSGAIVRTASGAKLVSTDTSCIAPSQIKAAGEDFRNLKYTLDTDKGLDRTREGYVEVIEMGVLKDAGDIAAATHKDGVPADCVSLRNKAKAGGSFNDKIANNLINEPTGGLYGFVTLINVNSGLKTSVDAVAIDDFYTGGPGGLSDLHAAPGDTAPSLTDVNTPATIIDGSLAVTFNKPTKYIDNLTAILSRQTIMNDYSIDAGRQSKTDWVVTFPTKRFYVNGGTTTPFASTWNATTTESCDAISLVYYDREERFHNVTVDEDFSPKPVVAPSTNYLCHEVNTLSIKPFGADAGYSTLFGAVKTAASFTVEDAQFQAGWMALSFNPTTTVITDAAGVKVTGLPAVGFSALSNTNGTLVVGGVNVLSNYLGSVAHKAQRNIVTP